VVNVVGTVSFIARLVNFSFIVKEAFVSIVNSIHHYNFDIAMPINFAKVVANNIAIEERSFDFMHFD